MYQKKVDGQVFNGIPRKVNNSELIFKGCEKTEYDNQESSKCELTLFFEMPDDGKQYILSYELMACSSSGERLNSWAKMTYKGKTIAEVKW